MPPARSGVVQLVPALDAGGAERATLEIAKGLVEAGRPSIVVSAGGRLVEKLVAEGSEHITLPLARKSPAAFRAVPELRRVLLRPDVGIAHVRSRLPGWLARIALRGATRRPAIVTTAHGLYSPGWYSAIMTRGDRIICVSNAVRDHMLRSFPQADPARLIVIPRGIDAHEFPYGYQPDDAWRRAFQAEFPQLAGGPLLTLPARGTRLKGHADAIRLLADLGVRGIEARLLLLGVAQDGRSAYVEELERLARSLGVADVVAMTPPRADIRDVFGASTLVLQLSTKPEAFGRTVVEALAMCRPVLGYGHGGVGELLAELYPAGRVPPGDRVRLAERAAELLRAAPPIAPLAHYRVEEMRAATLAVYDELAP